jgi:hypothetical protein
MPTYSRHAFQEEIIYPQMMAERTGENPDNYRNRPFDMDLLDYSPSAPSAPSAPPIPSGHIGGDW